MSASGCHPQVVYERTAGAASAPLGPRYRPRAPQKTVLYQLVQQHLETFLAEPGEHGGPGYPRYVERELRRVLTCGVPAHGFYRVRCPDCGHERLLGLSCGGRLCPSCWGRRMADTAAHLVDRVLPVAPYRQLVLSFPWGLRFHLARDPGFLSRMLRAFQHSVFAWQRQRGRAAGIADGHTGAVTFIQKFGGALNLNPHLHAITPDGLFVEGGPEGRLVFHPLPPPTDEEVQRLGARVARRLTKLARRHLAEGDEAAPDPDDEQAAVDHALDRALRPPVRPQTVLPGVAPVAARAEKPLCANVGGFSLHAARTVAAADREGLERLCRYGLRFPFSQQRLSALPDGRVRYELPRPWPTPGGVTHLDLEPLAFLKRLAALLPAPYQNLVRYHGVFANRSRFRERLPAPPPPPGLDDHAAPRAGKGAKADSASDDVDDADDAEPELPELPPRRTPWARLLKRTLKVDGLDCPRCHAQMVLLALITAPSVIERILTHLRIPATPPPVAPARSFEPPPELAFEPWDEPPEPDEPDEDTRARPPP